MDFEEALKRYVERAQEKTKERPYSNGKATTLTVRRGRRYVKVVEQDESCIFAFIDMTNGDVLYPNSWSKPAPHARGNIFADDPLKGTGPYGPEQLPNWRQEA